MRELGRNAIVAVNFFGTFASGLCRPRSHLDDLGEVLIDDRVFDARGGSVFASIGVGIESLDPTCFIITGWERERNANRARDRAIFEVSWSFSPERQDSADAEIFREPRIRFDKLGRPVRRDPENSHELLVKTPLG